MAVASATARRPRRRKDFFPLIRIFSLPSRPRFLYISLNDGDLYAAAPQWGEAISGMAGIGLTKFPSPFDILFSSMTLHRRKGRHDGAISRARIAALTVPPKPHERAGRDPVSAMRGDKLVARCHTSADGKGSAAEFKA